METCTRPIKMYWTRTGLIVSYSQSNNYLCYEEWLEELGIDG